MELKLSVNLEVQEIEIMNAILAPVGNRAEIVINDS